VDGRTTSDGSYALNQRSADRRGVVWLDEDGGEVEESETARTREGERAGVPVCASGLKPAEGLRLPAVPGVIEK